MRAIWPSPASYATTMLLKPHELPLPAYNRWTQIDKLWLAPFHPKNPLWNAVVRSSSLLHTMALLRNIWRQHGTLIPYNLKPPY